MNDLKQARSNLTEPEEFHRELFENSPTALYIQDFSGVQDRVNALLAQGVKDLKTHLETHEEETLNLVNAVKIVQINRATARMYKVDDASSFDFEFKKLIKSDDMQHFIDQVLTFTNGALEYKGEARNLDLKGNVLSIMLRKTVINPQKNGLSKILVSVTDLTDWYSSQEEKTKLKLRLQQAQKMESIGNLAGGIAHDFNNLLFPIVGMAEMLADDLPQGSPERENAEEILKAGKRGRDLVKQILSFSRQNDHRMARVQVQKIMKEALQLSRASIPTSIEMIEDLSPDCGQVMADPGQVHQIGMNLITNAFHAVEQDRGTIRVEVREATLSGQDASSLLLKPGPYVRLTVSDNGKGIPKDMVDKIFEPYYTTKKKGKGTGLGLSVVYAIVKEHQGAVKVRAGQDRGAAFDVFLPRIASPPKKAAAAGADPDQSGTERILLVDDEPPITRLVKIMLQRLGYRVKEYTSSMEALAHFKNDPGAYDLVITDMTMPQLTGDMLARQLMELRPDIPIIIFTGYSERIDREQAQLMGIKGFLFKPVVRSEMAVLVRNVLDGQKN